jgi:hypothetical protein
MPKKPHTHYMVDCFVPDSAHVDGYRTIPLHIIATSDLQAISEAKNGALQYNPHHIHIRAVTRQGDRIFYRSEDDD